MASRPRYSWTEPPDHPDTLFASSVLGTTQLPAPLNPSPPPPPPPAAIDTTSASRTSFNRIKRKPISTTASPVAARFSEDSPIPSPLETPKPDRRFERSASIDSPTLYEYPTSPDKPAPLTTSSSSAKLSSPEESILESRPGDDSTSGPELSDLLSEYDDSASDDLTPNAVVPRIPRFSKQSNSPYDFDDDPDSDENSTYSDNLNQLSATTSMFASKPAPPHLQLQKVDTSVGQSAPDHLKVESPHAQTPSNRDKPLPKSPGATSPFASFFGWGNPSPSGTEFSSATSPLSPNRQGGPDDTPRTTTKTSASDSTYVDKGHNNHRESYLSPLSPFNPASAQEIEDMEDELKAISSELAGSIRREIDLEDLVDRLQEQINNGPTPGKRSSDYFSDSGYSSAKQSEAEASRDEIEKVQRKSEQEKASLRLELTSKLQDERSRRKELDQQIKDLSARASQLDVAQMDSMNTSGRVKDLETTCEDLRRRLADERSSTNNFEDLLTALKGELYDACNERDNLRDEVMPRLRTRVEGLETEAAEYANLTYESTKMQQELQSLRTENMNLRSGGRVDDLPARASRTFSGGLARSSSVATGYRPQRGPSSTGLSRSNSVKAGSTESRDALAERLKDVEAQRDALHNALKNLLERQEFQNRENAKKISVLEAERERLLTGDPKRAGFQKEIASLRTEINVLRRRAEEAMEQKWQVEKGLGGLKMDLDRAEGEVASLRALLHEKDILIPEALARSSESSDTPTVPVTSASLNNAYQSLQATYADSLEYIKQLDVGISSGDKTHVAMERLQRALSVAVSERESARHEIEALKNRYDSVESTNLAAERALADELSESAQQIEQLAAHVQQQLSTNAELRQRVVDAVTRGDTERKANNDRIANLMEHLRQLEDQLVAAQTSSEDKIARHEEEITTMQDAHNQQLSRMNGSSSFGGLRSPAIKKAYMTEFMDETPSTFPGAPRKLPFKSFEEEAEIKTLRARVADMEKALEDTETEMQEVIARMNTAQIEVLNLQEAREAAVRETRRLQKSVEQAQMTPFEARFRTLTTSVK